MRGQKLRHPLHLKKVEKVSRGRHAHPTTGLVTARHQRLSRFKQAIDSAHATLMKAKAGTGERELASGALHQPSAELRFELLDAPTHGIGGHAQLSRGFCKAAATYYLHKHGDVIEVEHGE
ncbi:WASH_WAHD domain-containing protein [Pseudomonas sp. IT-P44]